MSFRVHNLEKTVIQATDGCQWCNHDCMIVCCMQTLEAMLDEMLRNMVQLLQRGSHSCGQKTKWSEKPTGSLWEQDSCEQQTDRKERDCLRFKEQEKAFHEVTVTPVENFVFVICQSHSQKWRSVVWFVESCVGERRFKATKTLDLCVV